MIFKNIISFFLFESLEIESRSNFVLVIQILCIQSQLIQWEWHSNKLFWLFLVFCCSMISYRVVIILCVCLSKYPKFTLLGEALRLILNVSWKRQVLLAKFVMINSCQEFKVTMDLLSCSVVKRWEKQLTSTKQKLIYTEVSFRYVNLL